MATHSSILAWEFLGTEESGGLQSTGLQRVGHELKTKATVINRLKLNITIYVIPIILQYTLI